MLDAVLGKFRVKSDLGFLLYIEKVYYCVCDGVNMPECHMNQTSNWSHQPPVICVHLLLCLLYIIAIWFNFRIRF